VSCPALETLEAELAGDCNRRSSTRSLKWNLAYIGGIEAFTVALSRFVLEEDFLRDADPAVRDLFEWHALEELEHRSVAFDVYEHLYGGYAYRVAVGAYAQQDFCHFTNRVMAVLLEQDHANGRDLGSKAEVRSRLRALSVRIVKSLLPKVMVSYSPRYAPQTINMPASSEAVLQRLAGWNPIAELVASEPAVAVPTAA
jgi:predicted metal-dependent hydrolase